MNHQMPKHKNQIVPNPKPWGSIRSSLHSLIAVLVATLLVGTVYLTQEYAVQFLEDSTSSTVVRTTGYSCNLFSGKWVFDNQSYPLYKGLQCTYMSDQLACEKFGRKDLSFQNWRWQPHQCNLSRFNATALLERLRNKRVVYVGDSLNRNQWVSMVCLIESAVPAEHKSMHTNGSLTTFKATEYNATVEFYWAPLLVESNSDHPVNHRIPERIVRVQAIEKHARHWSDADFLVFNSYLWWRRSMMSVLWGSFESSNGIYKDVKMPSIKVEGYWENSSDLKMMRVVENVLGELKTRGLDVQMLNITQLSQYRKEGHPSIYRKQWDVLTEEQLTNPSSFADCIHWCLPGVPDVWNELLYAYIFQ
ncbi:hypothetical protein ACLB2K_064215 [Fragaria x ananassa]